MRKSKKRTWLRRIWRVLRWPALLLLIFAGVLVYRAAHLGWQSKQMTDVVSKRTDLLARVDADKVAGVLSDFLEVLSLSDRDREKIEAAPFQKLHQILEESFPGAHRVMTAEKIGVNELSLLYRWDGANEDLEPILLMSHLDVVPIEEGTEDKWAHPQGEWKPGDRYIWGRGALDVKCGVIGIMAAVEILAESGFRPERTVYLAFGHDEEVGGDDGNGVIAETLAQRDVRLAFVLDEGGVILDGVFPGLDKQVAFVAIAEKAPVYFTLTAHGPGGHGSMPSPEAAIPVLAEAIRRIYEQPMPAYLHPATATLLDYLGPEMPFTQRLALGNRWLFEGLIVDGFTAKISTNAVVRSSINLTHLRTTKEIFRILPPVLNKTPTIAIAGGNGRLLPGETPQDMVDHIVSLLKQDPPINWPQTDAHTGVKWGVRCEITREDPDNPVASVESEEFKTLQRTIHEVFPDEIVAAGLTAVSTDSPWYYPLTDSVFRFIPMRLTGEDLVRIHGIDERIAVENMAEIVAFYQQLITNAAGPERN